MVIVVRIDAPGLIADDQTGNDVVILAPRFVGIDLESLAQQRATAGVRESTAENVQVRIREARRRHIRATPPLDSEARTASAIARPSIASPSVTAVGGSPLRMHSTKWVCSALRAAS